MSLIGLIVYSDAIIKVCPLGGVCAKNRVCPLGGECARNRVCPLGVNVQEIGYAH